MSRNPHASALRHYRHKVVPDERDKLLDKLADKEIDEIGGSASLARWATASPPS